MSVTYSTDPVIRWGLAQGRFTLVEGFTVTWKRGLTDVVEFEVPAGFQTDLASIPRGFRSIIPQVGKHLQPAIAHDFSYAGNTDLSKADTDTLFLEGMKSAGVWWLSRRVMYLAVRVGGKGHWG